jgi:hypothetical protein
MWTGQTVIRPFSRRVRRAAIRLLPSSTTAYILALRDSEQRDAATKRELCLGAPPSSSPGLKSTYTPPIPTLSPPPFTDIIVVVICFGRSSLSPGDSWRHTTLPSPTDGLERDRVGPCQSRLWTWKGNATRRPLHRRRRRWHSGEKLSEKTERSSPFLRHTPITMGPLERIFIHNTLYPLLI